jgi:hypothetical protein
VPCVLRFAFVQSRGGWKPQGLKPESLKFIYAALKGRSSTGEGIQQLSN